MLGSRSFFAVALVALAACGGATGEPATPSPTVRDSAGVRIVSNAVARDIGERAWSVDSVPMLRVDGDASDALLTNVQSVRRTSDGGVLILDGGSVELRRHGPDGSLAWRAGARGEGPGEFRAPMLVALDDSSVQLWDRAFARLTRFSLDGRLLGVAAYPDVAGRQPVAYGRFTDGALAVVLVATIPPPAPSGSGALLVDTIRYWRLPLTDSAAGEPTLIVSHLGPVRLFTGSALLTTPFLINPPRAVRGNALLSTSGPDATLLVHAADGVLRERVELSVPRVPVTAAAVDSVIDDVLASPYAMGSRADWERGRDVLPIPAFRPAFDRIVVGTDGEVWLRRYDWTRLASDASPPATRWDVIDREGAWLATVEMPSGLEVFDAGANWVAGVERDADGVESVVVWRLRRGR